MNKKDIFKVNILFEFHEGPWGGGNQFLKALRGNFIRRGIYIDNPTKADCVIFNSHQNFEDILKLKLSYKDKIFIHRLDGPLSLHRKNGLKIDKKIYAFNNILADGTIFLSEWSKKANYSLGIIRNNFETVILNAVDSNIFFPKKKIRVKDIKNDKWNLIAVSWSMNPNKGFDLYKFLDDNLDFNRYNMKFIGQCPIKFKNLEHIKPVEPKVLANILRDSDIYISGSQKEACSNSILEALACGIPCIVIDDASNPELLISGGELFNNYEECLEKIDLIRKNYEIYHKSIKIPSMDEVAVLYLNFIHNILSSKNYQIKYLRKIDYYKFLIKYQFFLNSKINKIVSKFYSLKERILKNCI